MNAASHPVPASLQPLQVKLLDPRFGDSWPLPAYATEASAGMDLRAATEAADVVPVCAAIEAEIGRDRIDEGRHADGLAGRGGEHADQRRDGDKAAAGGRGSAPGRTCHQ